jgi:DNA mismatch repair protein MSH6
MGGNQILGEDEGTSFSSSHPNSRAILYEAKTHTKRKLGDFSKVLNGLKHVSRIPEIFSNVDIQSGLLKKIVRFQKDGGCFPEISDRIDEFFSMFDFEEAANGNFEPGRGIDPEFDEALDAIDQIKAELENYRDEMISKLQPRHLAQSWKYVNTGKDSKDKYTIELPASVKVPNDFRMTGKRGKGTKQVVSSLTIDIACCLVS